jgi:hypothetical protein
MGMQVGMENLELNILELIQRTLIHTNPVTERVHISAKPHAYESETFKLILTSLVLRNYFLPYLQVTTHL